MQIKRMHPYNEYVVLRKEFRELELERLFKLSRQRTMPEFSQYDDTPLHLAVLTYHCKAEFVHPREEGSAVYTVSTDRGDAPR